MLGKKQKKFFFAKLTIFLQPETKIALRLKRLKVETWNLELMWGTYRTTFLQILGKNQWCDTDFQAKQPKYQLEVQIALTRKLTAGGEKNFLNLEALGNAVLAPTFNFFEFRLFFIYLIICLFI